VYFVPAFVGLGAPHWDPDARGTIVGLTRGTGRAHLARAALESIAYSTREVLDAMERDSGVSTAELRVDGGATENDWLMRFQAGILGIPVRRARMVETTALGAAGLSGIAEGVWSDAEAFLAAQPEAVEFGPELGDEERDRRVRGWDRAVRATRAWSADRIEPGRDADFAT
jgi:glycerol kinase